MTSYCYLLTNTSVVGGTLLCFGGDGLWTDTIAPSPITDDPMAMIKFGGGLGAAQLVPLRTLISTH